MLHLFKKKNHTVSLLPRLTSNFWAQAILPNSANQVVGT